MNRFCMNIGKAKIPLWCRKFCFTQVLGDIMKNPNNAIANVRRKEAYVQFLKARVVVLREDQS